MGFVISILSMTALANGQAPSIRFENVIDRVDPISHQMGGANSIAQDDLGFIWIGAENGVGRYDGHNLKLYHANPLVPGSLPASYVRSLVVDHDGVLWVASEGGLARYNYPTDSFTRIEALGDTRIDVETVSSLAVADDNTLYVGSARGLYVIEPDRTSMSAYFPRPPVDLEPTNEQIRDIAIDKQGKIWLGTAGMGVVIFDPKSKDFTYILHQANNPNSLVHNDVTSIMHDSQNRVWLGTLGGGISRLNPVTGNFDNFFRSINDDDSLKADVVQDIVEDSEGIIWIALDQGGLARFNEQTQSFHSYMHTVYDPNSIVSNQLRTIFEDNNRDLWLGAFPSGVSFYNRSTQLFRHYTNNPDDPHSLSHSAILTFEEASDGTIWVGTEGGLNALNPETGKFRRYLSDPRNPQSLRADPVLAVEEDIDGQLWVGTWAGGLHRLDPDTGLFQRFSPGRAEGVKSDFIWSILKDSQDNIWIGTETAGLVRFNRDTNNFTHFDHNPYDTTSIPGNFISSLIVDENEQVWVGTFTGLARFNPIKETFVSFPYGTGKPDATNSKSFRSLFEDSKGNIWAGTQHRGVNIYNPEDGTFRYLDVQEGLPSSTVSSILEDHLGNIWLATTNGLVQIDTANGSMRHFLRIDGLVGNNFNRNASLKDRNGNLYFGSSEGITVFHPDDLNSSTHGFPLRITDFRLLNKPVPIGAENSPLKTSILLTEELTLRHEDTMFSFDFAALNYRQSGAIQYSYTLEGFDRGWNDIGRSASATYTNIGPGQYRFRTRASTDGEAWIEGQSLTITVLPPFWRTWWAYLIYVVLVGILLLFSQKYIALRVRAKIYQSQAISDPLTNLYNRAGIAQIAEGIFANPETKKGMSLMLLDIDHFKRINDLRGHDAGDRILCEVARVARGCLRSSDHLGRWGGEEFVLLCATSEGASSFMLAEKVRTAIASVAYENHNQFPVHVTVSIGIADLQPEDSFDSVLKRADMALYKAKEAGRNCVISADGHEVVTTNSDAGTKAVNEAP